MLKFHDDPRPLINQLKTAWNKYSKTFDKAADLIQSSVKSWRWATGDMFKAHPLFGLVDTTPIAEPWATFTQSWLRDDSPEANLEDAWQHGIDKHGRIVLVRRDVWGELAFWGRGYCDRLTYHISDADRSRLIWGAPYQDSVEISRLWFDDDGRIQCTCQYSREDDEQYRNFEWFEYKSNKCVESIQQWFVIKPKLHEDERDMSDEELIAIYRPLEGRAFVNNLVEDLLMRRRVKYTYNSNGELAKAENFSADGKPETRLLFLKPSNRSLEMTSKLFVDKTSKVIINSIQKRASEKPYRGVVLVYSAEHAHCGLPSRVFILPHDSKWPKERYCHEAYPTELQVDFKRPILSILAEFNQCCNARFGTEGISSIGKTVSKAMESMATEIYKTLAKTAHVANDFAVIAIDDHGDIDPIETPRPKRG